MSQSSHQERCNQWIRMKRRRATQSRASGMMVNSTTNKAGPRVTGSTKFGGGHVSITEKGGNLIFAASSARFASFRMAGSC